MRDSRLHFISRTSAERALLGIAEEDQVFSLMMLAETYGSVNVPIFEMTDDAWGKHYSLDVSHTPGNEWIIVLTGHPHY